MFVVVVRFQLHAGCAEAFMPLMAENARLSVELEPACHQFDVCVSTESADEILLYEIYDSPEAFQAHLKMPHFLSFDAEVRDMVLSKEVGTFRRVEA